MEFKEEVHSDGSYELVDMDDISSNMDRSSDYSYDFLSSEEEGSNNTTVNEDNTQIKSCSLEYEEDEEEDEEEGMEFLDSKDMGKKQKLYEKLKKVITIKEVAKSQILHYLPAKSLARCLLVSKEWESWISNPFFAHTQSQSFSQTSGFFEDEYDSIRFISLDPFSYGVPNPSLKFLGNFFP